jgi:hypothetical protein
LAANFSPALMLASLGNSVRFIFFAGCIAGLPKASFGGNTPSSFAPVSLPVSTVSSPGSIVPPPCTYSTTHFSMLSPPTMAR